MLKGVCYLRNKVEQPQLDRIWGSSAFPQFRDSTREVRGEEMKWWLEWNGKACIKWNPTFSAMQTKFNWVSVDLNELIPLGKKPPAHPAVFQRALGARACSAQLRSATKFFLSPFSVAAWLCQQGSGMRHFWGRSSGTSSKCRIRIVTIPCCPAVCAWYQMEQNFLQCCGGWVKPLMSCVLSWVRSHGLLFQLCHWAVCLG